MQTTTERPASRRREKLVPQGVPFDELSPGQQEAVRSLRKLREQMAAEIERMIDFLDSTDGYSTIEVEEDDADPTDAALRRAAPASAGTLEDDEPSLGSVGALSPGNPYFDQSYWAVSGKDDRESDGADDPNGEEVNEDGDGNPDDEPALGFLECFTGSGRSGQAGDCTADREDDGSYVTAAARQRYKPFDRNNTNRDGKHVDSERGFGVASRRIRNLSDQQRAAVEPRLSDEVRLS